MGAVLVIVGIRIRTRFDSQSMDLFSTYWVRHGHNRLESVGIDVGTGTVNASGSEDRQCGRRVSTANVRSDDRIERVDCRGLYGASHRTGGRSVIQKLHTKILERACGPKTCCSASKL